MRWFALALLALLTGCAGSDYRELRAAYEQADPADAYPLRVEIVPRPSADAPQPTELLSEAQEELRSQQARWQERLRTPPAAAAEEPTPDAAPEQLAERLAEELDLSLLRRLTPRLNPAVQAARLQLRAALEHYSQATQLDTILRQYNAFTRELDTGVGPQQHKQPMAGSFPYPDTLALKGEVVDADVALAKLAEEIAVRDALAAVEETFYDLIFVAQSLRIHQENQALLRQIISVTQAKIRGDRTSYNAVLMAQVELSKLHDAILELEGRQETLRTELNSLLGRPPDAPLAKPAEVTDQVLKPELPELYALAVERRQELQQQRLRIERLRTMIELASRMTYPDASLGASYLEEGMGKGFMPQRDLNRRQASNVGHGDAYIRESRLRAAALEQTLEAMADQTRLAVKEAHFRLVRARQRLDLYDDSLLPQAQQSLENAMSSYRAGDTDFLTFLEAERTRLAYLLEDQRARRDLRTAQTRLDQLAGGRLPREPIANQEAP